MQNLISTVLKKKKIVILTLRQTNNNLFGAVSTTIFKESLLKKHIIKKHINNIKKKYKRNFTLIDFLKLKTKNIQKFNVATGHINTFENDPFLNSRKLKNKSAKQVERNKKYTLGGVKKKFTLSRFFKLNTQSTKKVLTFHYTHLLSRNYNLQKAFFNKFITKRSDWNTKKNKTQRGKKKLKKAKRLFNHSKRRIKSSPGYFYENLKKKNSLLPPKALLKTVFNITEKNRLKKILKTSPISIKEYKPRIGVTPFKFLERLKSCKLKEDYNTSCFRNTQLCFSRKKKNKPRNVEKKSIKRFKFRLHYYKFKLRKKLNFYNAARDKRHNIIIQKYKSKRLRLIKYLNFFNNSSLNLHLLLKNQRLRCMKSNGSIGFKGPKRQTPFASEKLGLKLSRYIKKKKFLNYSLFIILRTPFSPNLRAFFRGFFITRPKVDFIIPIFKVPHNRMRGRKPRRV